MKVLIVFDGKMDEALKFKTFGIDDVCFVLEEISSEDDRINTFNRLEIIVEK